jgi:N-acetylglucosaminyldiphosphoundecaprenol N-acetyl-beta-D-mannosaminyltransferase
VNKLNNKVKILNLDINKIRLDDLVNHIVDLINNAGKKQLIYTPNSEIVVKAYDDNNFADMYSKADILTADGSGLVLASKILNDPIPERVAGFDITVKLLDEIANRDISCYFIGGKEDIIELAYKKIKKSYPKIDIKGYHHGYLNNELEEKVMQDIKDKKPDILFVGMGVPLQEKFFSKYFDQLDVKVGITVGGTFDVLSGQVNRAPKIMQKLYLEWFYRLLQDPKRWKRMLALPRFLYLVLKEKYDV